MAKEDRKKYKAKNNKNHTTGGKATVRHDFDSKEWSELANRHLRMLQDIEVKKAQRKAASEVAKAAIEEVQSRAKDLGNQLSNGHEMVEVDALVEFDRKAGVKHYYHHCPENPEQHNVFIESKQMSEEDYQLLSLDDVQPPKPADGSLPNPALPPDAKVEPPEDDPAGHGN